MTSTKIADDRDDGKSVDPGEVARFSAMAEAWWDPEGDFRPLHALNPVRLAFIRDRVTAHFGRPAQTSEPLAGLRVLDVGCGGGLLCEPMRRLGATVVGVDASARNIEIARAHAAQSELDIEYHAAAAESLAATGRQFDVVLTMEVVEHVADLDALLGACRAMLDPAGIMFLATLNRTAKAFAFAILGAEYALRWLPRGTHDWRRFVRPSELAAGLRRHGLTVTELAGVRYAPLSGDWRLVTDLSVNYMAVAVVGD